MIKKQKQKHVSIERKTRANHHGRLTQLVHTIEKINSNLDDHRNSSSSVTHETGVGSAQTNDKKLLGDSLADESNDKSNETIIEDKELCFKVSQLVTELLLMLFAASLLSIAAVVILSRKTPAIMESYDVVPKALFFICVIVASVSFFRWLVTKFKSIFMHNNQNMVETRKLFDKVGSRRLVSHKNGMAEQFIKLKSQDQIGYIQEAMALPGTAAIVSAGMATKMLGDRNLITSDLSQNKNGNINMGIGRDSSYSNMNTENTVLESVYGDNMVTTRNISSLDRRYKYSSTSDRVTSDSAEVSTSAPRGLLDDFHSSKSGQSLNRSIKLYTTNNVIDEETSLTNENCP